MPERRGGTGDTGIANENVELAVALMQRRAKPRDAVEIGEVQWHQRGAAAVLSDLVVELLQSALRARDGHNMRAGTGECAGASVAYATSGPSNQGLTGCEGSA